MVNYSCKDDHGDRCSALARVICRDAQDNGEYARAFFLCAECCKSMEGMSTLKVAQQLNATINQLYEETVSRLEGALQSVCNDFRANQYMKVTYTHARHINNNNNNNINAFQLMMS